MCLSVSVSSFHSLCLLYLRANIQQKPQLSLIPTPSPPASLIFPLSSLFLLVWVDGNKRPQVYQRVWSLLAEPPSCGRSMTKPVRAAHCYSRIDCIWKPMHHVVNELKKWPANIDQISWQPSISHFLWGLWKERAVVERRKGCLFYGNAEQAQFLFCFMASLSDWRKRENSVTFWACRFIHGLRKTSTVKNGNTRFSILTLQSHQVDCPLVLK